MIKKSPAKLAIFLCGIIVFASEELEGGLSSLKLINDVDCFVATRPVRNIVFNGARKDGIVDRFVFARSELASVKK